MADDQSVTTTDEGFVPEPVPDNLVDTALDGLQPADESTDSEQVEDEPDETEQDQPDDTTDEVEEDADDSGEPKETEADDAKDDGQEEVTEQPDPKEAARLAYEQRQAAKAQRNYVQEERQKVRQYESDLAFKIRTGELDDIQQIKENQKIIQANQYLDSVERTQMSIMNEGQQALSEIPFFKSDTPASQAIFQSALQSFRDAYGVYDDDSGALVAVEDRRGNPVSLYSYLANEAARIESIVSTAQRQTQKSEAKMRSKVVTPSNPGKVTSSGDELEDLLERVGDVRLA